MTRTLADFEVVVDSKEVFDKHRCFEKGRRGAGNSVEGRIICCKDCGRHWYVKQTFMDENLIWKPVRWYHYRMRRAIVGK